MESTKPIPDEIPYRIDRFDGGRVIVRFAEICDHERREEWITELRELVETADQVVCDLSQTHNIVSGWFRLLEHLTVDAEASGKRFVVAAVRESVRKSADVIGVGKRIQFVPTVEEGWES